MSIFNRKPRLEPASSAEPDMTDGLLLSEIAQNALSNKRSQKELARAETRANWMTIVALASMGVAVIEGIGWGNAVSYYANNVRVTWVKLLPDGSHQVQYFDDGGATDRFFEATVNASLSNYAERRYRKVHSSISADYGFAAYFMSDAHRTEFLSPQGYNAAKTAADFEKCNGCEETAAHVLTIDHETLNTPDKQNAETGTYQSSIYYDEVTTSATAAPRHRRRLVKVLWSLRKVEQIPKDTEYLKANPLAIQILDEHSIDDTGANVGTPK
ncbi:MAG TPA: hypothetical protein VGU69_10405 [Rhizomicrobium sp.]|nr:hypothetical protein [Rhizomicrobium sp.]